MQFGKGSGLGAMLAKEFLSPWRDARLVTALLLIAVLYAAALLLGWGEHRRAQAEYDAARAEVREAWLDQGERNPHDAGHSGTFVFKRSHPLRMVERGAADYMGQVLHLETHRQNDARHHRAREATSLFRFGSFSPAQVVTLLFPLVLLIMTHAAITGEEESGTAGLLRSTGVSPGILQAGKAGGAFLFAGAWLAPLLVMTWIAVWAAAEYRADAIVGMTALTGLLAVYCATFVLIGIAISTLCRGSHQALAVSFTIWALLCVVLPRAGASVAAAAAPAPSAIEFKRALEAERDNKWSIAYRGRGNFREVYRQAELRAMHEQGVTHTDELTIDPFGLAIEETEEEGQHAYDATLQRVLDAFERQNAMHRLFGLITPVVALSTSMAALSETDLAAHRRFADAAEDYRRETMRKLNLDIAYNARLQAADDVSSSGFVRGFTRGPEFWATFPEFEAPTRSRTDMLAAVVPESMWLIGWLILSAFFGQAALRRRWR
jgi:ABC-2 type transport system permease protein